MTVNAGAAVAVTVAVEVGEVAGLPDGSSPVAVAELATDPASMSACVTVYGAVQVTLAPGASALAPAGQEAVGTVPLPENEPSLIVMPCRVTLPVLVTRNE